jgi:hypothetical protein
MKIYGRVEVYLHAFLNLALDEGEWSASRPFRFTPGERAQRYPLDRRLGGLQSRSGRCGEDEKVPFLPLSGFELRSSTIVM